MEDPECRAHAPGQGCAAGALQRAVELLPQDAETHTNLGAELNERGQFEAGLASLRQALQISPYNADALVAAGNAQRHLGRPRR